MVPVERKYELDHLSNPSHSAHHVLVSSKLCTRGRKVDLLTILEVSMHGIKPYPTQQANNGQAQCAW